MVGVPENEVTIHVRPTGVLEYLTIQTFDTTKLAVATLHVLERVGYRQVQYDTSIKLEPRTVSKVEQSFYFGQLSPSITLVS